MEHISSTIDETMQELRKSHVLFLQRKKEVLLELQIGEKNDSIIKAFKRDGKLTFNFQSLWHAGQTTVRQEN